jgi:hypothetical protein
MSKLSLIDECRVRSLPSADSLPTWVCIQKPVVTYDPLKFSVTSHARLPNYLKINYKI